MTIRQTTKGIANWWTRTEEDHNCFQKNLNKSKSYRNLLKKRKTVTIAVKWWQVSRNSRKSYFCLISETVVRALKLNVSLIHVLPQWFVQLKSDSIAINETNMKGNYYKWQKNGRKLAENFFLMSKSFDLCFNSNCSPKTTKCRMSQSFLLLGKLRLGTKFTFSLKFIFFFFVYLFG